MEILQTICNVLTTQNERLTSLICIPLSFIEAYLYMLVFTSCLKINCTRMQKILYVLLFPIFSLLSMYLIPSPYYTFVNLLIFPLLVFLIFKVNILNSFLAEIISYSISLLTNTPIIAILVYIFKIPSVAVSTTPFYRIIECLISYLLTYLLYVLLLKHSFSFSSSLNKFKCISNKYLLINFIFGIISIAIQFYIEFAYIDYIPYYLIILSLLVLLVYFLISIYSLIRTTQLEATSKKLEEEKLYNQTLTVLYDKIRGFKHDFNNIVQGIGGYISTNNMDGLKEYYSQVLDDCQKVNNLALLSPDVINNPAIYSLITAKYHKAMEYGIKIDLEVFMDLTNINMKIYLLTRALGILIDNAIEAAKDCDDKEIIITFRKDIQKNKQLFIIQNTYSNKDVNIDEIFEKGKTTKVTNDCKNHGLGLWEIRQLLKKNHNLNLYTTKTEKYFKQQFEIYC